MRVTAVSLALGLLLSSLAARAVELPDTLINRIAKGQCEEAVKQLNGMLQTPSAATYLIAGSMYERGACLKPDAERARELYAKAFGLGDVERAPVYLAALAASRAGGADVGQLLWWFGRIKDHAAYPVPEPCRVARTEDVEAFVGLIEAWSIERRETCRMTVGLLVMAGAIKPFYPFESLREGGHGRFEVQIVLDTGEVRVIEREGFRTAGLKRMLERLYQDATKRLGKPSVPLNGVIASAPWEFKIQ